MTTAIDTNVIVALWDAEDTLHLAARAALDKAFDQGALVISGLVFAELMAAPGRTQAFLDQFCAATSIAVDWHLGEKVCRAAGAAFQAYAARRRKQRGIGARRILADFLIGAHAMTSGYKLLTLDSGIYAASFPKLPIVTL